LYFIDGECREMGRENKEAGAMQTCYCLTFSPFCSLLCVATLVFPTFSVFKVVYHEQTFAFSPFAISVMP